MRICLTANKAWNLVHFRMNHMLALMDLGIEVHAVAPVDGYEQQLIDAGIHFHPWNIERRSLNPFREVVSVRRIQTIYKRIQPDLVHHYTVKAVLYGTTAARLSGVKAIVNSVTGLPYIIVSPKSGMTKRLARWIAMRWYGWSVVGKNTHVVLQNEDDLEMLETFAQKVRSASTITNGSGVSLSAFRQQPLPHNDPANIVFVGRFLREKGIFELMDAARAMRQKGIRFRLTLCGDIDPGNRSSATFEQCEQWKQEGLVNEMGRVDDVRPFLAASDLVVLPSYREGTPRSLLEAMAVGRPIITTDVPGCRNVVDDGVNGCLVPARSSQELVVAISHLLDHAELRVKMGAAGRVKAEQEFCEDEVIDQNLRVYFQLRPDCMPSREQWSDLAIESSEPDKLLPDAVPAST